MRALCLLPALLFFIPSCKKSAETREETSTGGVIQVDSEDVEMNAAMQEARDSFHLFWSEVSTDYQRATPALAGASVKALFTEKSSSDDGEHLWVGAIQFDGELISGIVQSEPLDLSEPKLGDKVEFPLSRLSDWLIVQDGMAKGVYTVQLLRKRMSPKERAEHDSHYPFSFQ